MLAVRAVEQRQQRERTGGVEDLPRHTVMRLAVRQPGHDRPVAVIPGGEAEPGFVAGGALAAFGGDEQVSLKYAAIVQRDSHPVRPARPLHWRDAVQPFDQRFSARGIEQRQPDIAVGIHPAERAFVRIGTEIESSWFHPVSHRNRRNRTAKRRQPRFQPDVAKQVPAGGRNGGGTAIGPGSGQRRGIFFVDHIARYALLRCRQRQRHAHQPAAQDHQISLLIHTQSLSQLLPDPASRSRQRPSNVPSGSFSPNTAASVGAMSTVSTGAGCSNPRSPLRQNSIGTRRS